MKVFKKKPIVLATTAAVLCWSAPSLAQDDEAVGGIFSELWNKTSFNGSLRVDAAYRTSSFQNPYNQTNMPFQDVDVPRQAYVPPSLSTGILNNAISIPALAPLATLLGGITSPTGQVLGATNWNVPIPGFADTVKRSEYVGQQDTEWNYANIRFTGEMDTRFYQNLRLNVRARALYDPAIYDEFNANDVSDIQGGISGGGGSRYADTGRPNLYAAKARNGKNLNPLEIAGRDYMLDLPTFILNYKKDSYDIRFGNQQIAWGQAIFFRTFDVANGLDYRRHLVIDRAIEEYEDERVSKIALRGTIQATDSILVDSFIGKFQPDIVGNPNTPFNVIPSQFYKPLDNYYAGDYDTKIDYGIRLKADFGNYGYQAMAVTRYNPLGVFRWAESGISKGLYGGVLGGIVTAAYQAKLPNCGAAYNPSTCRQYANIEEALSHTPFTVGPGGVYSGKEWFSTAASVRLDGLDALNTAIREFPALQDVFASEVMDTEQAEHLLNTFFMGAGGSIRGNVQRDYYRENVFGLGGSYVTAADPESFWDSIILNLEAQYTPERAYTRPDLGRDPIKSDEYIITAVAEKWYRYSDTIPAAYLVFQYQHRSDSDLVGLNLKGYGGTIGNNEPKRSDGIGSANYLVFAGFQPTPNRKFVFEWAFLLDTQGGLLAQPNVRWNAGSRMAVDLFYNFVDGKLYGDGTNTLQRAFDYADEVSLRFTYAL